MPIQHFRSKKPPFPLPWSWRRHKNIYKVFPSCLPTHDILNDKISNSNSTNPGHHFSWLNDEKPPFLYIFHGFWWNSPFLMLRTPRDPVTPLRIFRHKACRAPNGFENDTQQVDRELRRPSVQGRAGMKWSLGQGYHAYFRNPIFMIFPIPWNYESGFFWPNFGEYPIISPQS